MNATEPQPNQLKILKMVADAIISAIKEAGPHGAPGGILYAALMQYGCSITAFEQIMAGLQAADVVTKRGELYFVV